MTTEYNDEMIDDVLDNNGDEDTDTEIVTVESPASDIPQDEVDKGFQPPAPEPAPSEPAPSEPAPKKPLTAEEIAAMKLGGGIKDASIGGLSLSERALATKLKLSKEPKVSTFIPLAGGEKAGAYKAVTINGYRMEIKKNMQVTLPQSVFNLIMRSLKASTNARSNHPLNLAEAPEHRSRAL